MIYEMENLEEAREFLSSTEQKIILSNIPESVKYYGMRVIDNMFKKLQEEFPSKIEKIIVNVGDDYCAFITASNLGYSEIIYKN